MSEKTSKTVRIKWVRSGIGFSHYQKTIVRSLGLRKLNQVVVRPDTPQIRGIVAAVPHLLSIVPEVAPQAWASIPEYTVEAVKVEPAPPPEPVGREAVGPGNATAGELPEGAGESVQSAPPVEDE